MYTSFTIQNFRCFERLELSDLARVNLIAGKNNAGKTSLLEAIYINVGNIPQEILFRMSSDPADREPPYEGNSSRSLPAWRSLFRDFNTAQPIALTGHFDSEVFEAVMQVVPFDEMEFRETYISQGLRPIDLPYHLRSVAEVLKVSHQNKVYYAFQRGSQVHHDRIPKPLLPISFSPAQGDVSPQRNVAPLSRFILSGRRDLILGILCVLEPRLQNIEILFDIPYGHVGLAEPIPITLMGEGINRLLSIILTIGSTSGGVVLIDEIENGLHYSVLVDVWRAIGRAAREFDVQVFATTHSLETIHAAHQAFSESEPYDFRYHRLDRRRSGEIAAVTYEAEDMESSIESNFEVR
jgi:hypothetical protein